MQHGLRKTLSAANLVTRKLRDLQASNITHKQGWAKLICMRSTLFWCRSEFSQSKDFGRKALASSCYNRLLVIRELNSMQKKYSWATPKHARYNWAYSIFNLNYFISKVVLKINSQFFKWQLMLVVCCFNPASMGIYHRLLFKAWVDRFIFLSDCFF